jgi:predicted flavoprotein YhiN
LLLDLLPDMTLERLQDKLEQARKGRSLTEHLRRSVGIAGVKVGLVYELVAKSDLADASKLAALIKALPVALVRPRPIIEAISSAGGVHCKAFDPRLMVKSLPGVFCAGEMLDWEAPTGGYLLTACFASGRVAGQGAADWLASSL